jgi:hypothetical protein
MSDVRVDQQKQLLNHPVIKEQIAKVVRFC